MKHMDPEGKKRATPSTRRRGNTEENSDPKSIFKRGKIVA